MRLSPYDKTTLDDVKALVQASAGRKINFRTVLKAVWTCETEQQLASFPQFDLLEDKPSGTRNLLVSMLIECYRRHTAPAFRGAFTEYVFYREFTKPIRREIRSVRRWVRYARICRLDPASHCKGKKLDIFLTTWIPKRVSVECKVNALSWIFHLTQQEIQCYVEFKQTCRFPEGLRLAVACLESPSRHVDLTAILRGRGLPIDDFYLSTYLSA
jgi:hypothetical protein